MRMALSYQMLDNSLSFNQYLEFGANELASPLVSQNVRARKERLLLFHFISFIYSLSLHMQKTQSNEF